MRCLSQHSYSRLLARFKEVFFHFIEKNVTTQAEASHVIGMKNSTQDFIACEREIKNQLILLFC